jgi:hypothetical protein
MNSPSNPIRPLELENGSPPTKISNKAPSPTIKANEAIRNLFDENDRLRKAPREGNLFQWNEGAEKIAQVVVADALAGGCCYF